MIAVSTDQDVYLIVFITYAYRLHLALQNHLFQDLERINLNEDSALPCKATK